MRISYLIISLLFFFSSLNAQVNYTAHDQIPPYTAPFSYGSNMGYYPPWTDEELADIAAGNPAKGIKGVGVNSLRPALYEWFLEQWGYDIRLNAFAHYQQLGITNNVCFIGYPSDGHRSLSEFCEGERTEIFANLYLDIWDGGANGTPVNDNNYFALYLYKMVSKYKDYVKIWVIWNVPDFDFSGNAWKPDTMEGNWWQNDPAPCDYALKAPVYYYVRMLRIAYEVIKSVDSEAYIAVGGLGFPSFLDAILRNTDHPDDGTASNDYPLGGGAYFDVLSYHVYPHIDGSMKAWNNAIGDFDYFRHSDAAMEGVLLKKKGFEEVLADRGYDGSSYPEKHWIITESNIPRKAFGEYVGSVEAQRNFVIKSLVACQMNNISQFHLYSLAESSTFDAAANEFQMMGLYQKIDYQSPNSINTNDAGVAYKTTADFLRDHHFDSQQTAALQLPANARGAAFTRADGSHRYVLWAATTTDQSEVANAPYTFPASFGINSLLIQDWDHSQTQQPSSLTGAQINLTGAPLFIIATQEDINPPTPTIDIDQSTQIQCYPNPFHESLQLSWTDQNAAQFQLKWYNTLGELLAEDEYEKTPGQMEVEVNIPAELPNGLYWLEVSQEAGKPLGIQVVKQ